MDDTPHNLGVVHNTIFLINAAFLMLCYRKYQGQIFYLSLLQTKYQAKLVLYQIYNESGHFIGLKWVNKPGICETATCKICSKGKSRGYISTMYSSPKLLFSDCQN